MTFSYIIRYICANVVKNGNNYLPLTQKDGAVTALCVEAQDISLERVKDNDRTSG